MEEADPGEPPMDEENLEIEVYPMAGRTFSDDPDCNEFQDLINNPWQPLNCAEDLKQAIWFINAHYPKSQIDLHFDKGRWKIPMHFAYLSGWMMYNQFLAMDNQLPKFREASISTPHGRRLFYFQYLLECVQYLLRQCPYTDHMVYGRTRAVDK